MPGSNCEIWRQICDHYVDILGNQVHPMVQILFHNNDIVFRDDNSLIHAAICVQSRFEEHEDALQYLFWSTQSPDLTNIKPLWPVLKSRVRIRLPPPSSLKQLDVPLEEWYSIPLETTKN
jgi:transposase